MSEDVTSIKHYIGLKEICMTYLKIRATCFKFPHQNLYAFIFFSHLSHVPPISYSLILLPTYCSVRIKILEAFYYSVLSSSCYFIPHQLYIPQHTLLSHAQSIFFSK